MSRRSAARIAELLAAASAGVGQHAVRSWGRQVQRAELAVWAADTDADTGEALDCHLDHVHRLAGAPSAGAADVAVKLAALMRLRLADAPGEFDTMQRAEFALLASALADLVMLGGSDRPAIAALPRERFGRSAPAHAGRGGRV